MGGNQAFSAYGGGVRSCLRASAFAVSERLRRGVAPYEPPLHGYSVAGVAGLRFQAQRRLGIGADIIVGFPGETTEQFRATKQFLEAAPISYLHVFPFSSRPGTAATKLGGELPKPELAKRADELRDLSRRLRQSFHQRQVGARVEIIAENRGSTKYVYGHARNYADVAIPKDIIRTGQIAQFFVERADADFLYCKPIGQEI